MSQASSSGRRSASQARGREGGAMRWASADGAGWQAEPVGDGGGSASPALIPALPGRLGAVAERAEPRLHLGVPAAPESHRQPEGAAAALPRPGVLTGAGAGPGAGMWQPVCRRRGQPRGFAPGSTGHGAVLEPAERRLCSAVPVATGTRSGSTRQPGAHGGCGQARAMDTGVSNRGIFVCKAALPFSSPCSSLDSLPALARGGGRSPGCPPRLPAPEVPGWKMPLPPGGTQAKSIPMSRKQHVCLSPSGCRLSGAGWCCWAAPQILGGSPRGDLPFPLPSVSHGRCWLRPLSQPLGAARPQQPRGKHLDPTTTTRTVGA